MSRAAPRRGPDHLNRLAFQVLDLQVGISFADPHVAAPLRMLEHGARHVHAATRSVEYEIVSVPQGFDVTKDGSPISTLPYPIDVLTLLESDVYAHALRGSTPMMAACARVEGGRVLLVGDHDARLVALLLTLLRDGDVVEGDWCVAVDGASVTTVARALRVQQDVLPAFPEAAALVGGRPSVQDALGRVIWSFDPAGAGFGWDIAPAAIDCVVVVESNPGGRSRLESRPRHETAQEVVAVTGAPARERIAIACALVDAAACRRLRLGDLDEAAALLRAGVAQLKHD